ncbi:hypothetical protein [Montanilutibacter psychrotolerans]|nr:hypothetical protein [Lysobacter psychrotolerans]
MGGEATDGAIDEDDGSTGAAIAIAIEHAGRTFDVMDCGFAMAPT